MTRAPGHLASIAEAASAHARQAWADIGNTYQNFLWSTHGLRPPYPSAHVGPEGLAPFDPHGGQNDPWLSLTPGGRIARTEFAPPGTWVGAEPPAAPTALHAARDVPDSLISTPDPPQTNMSLTVTPNYKGHEIQQPDLDI